MKEKELFYINLAGKILVKIGMFLMPMAFLSIFIVPEYTHIFMLSFFGLLFIALLIAILGAHMPEKIFHIFD